MRAGTREDQSYGSNKKTKINHSYINSSEYRRRFDDITSSDKLNRLIYEKAKEMLSHRSGTLFEDMYWFDFETEMIVDF